MELSERQIMRIVAGFAWLLVLLLAGGAIVAVYKLSSTCDAAELVEEATEYAKEAAENELHAQEEAIGPPWPAHGVCDYNVVYVKSTDYEVDGDIIQYTFVMYIQQTIMGGMVDTGYYTVTVKSDNGIFSLMSVELIPEDDPVYSQAAET